MQVVMTLSLNEKQFISKKDKKYFKLIIHKTNQIAIYKKIYIYNWFVPAKYL
jgi:predicted KAP-like P-loop ATPase